MILRLKPIYCCMISEIETVIDATDVLLCDFRNINRYIAL